MELIFLLLSGCPAFQYKALQALRGLAPPLSQEGPDSLAAAKAELEERIAVALEERTAVALEERTAVALEERIAVALEERIAVALALAARRGPPANSLAQE